MEPYVGVLLVEQEPETVTLLTLSLSEIKECKLTVTTSGEEAILRMPEIQPRLILLSHGLQGRDCLEITGEIHRRYPTIHIIVSILEHDPKLADQLMIAGASDIVAKSRNYVPDLLSSVKKALIRISERDAFELPLMSRASQFVIDEHLPDVIFTLDLGGKILHVNRAVSSQMGFEPRHIVGNRFLDFIVFREDQDAFQEYLTHSTDQISFRRIGPLRHKNGKEHIYEMDFTLMEGETIYGVARKEKSPDQEGVQINVDEEEEGEWEIEDKDSEPVPTRLGPYRIVTLLGAGAMGRVYKGLDEQLDRYTAIKVINKSLISHEESLERFRREAKILASMCHPNIALIYYFGSVDGLPYFCMEYLDEGSLEDLREKDRIMDPESVISFAIQVAMGLKAAQDKGVIHMDIKPSNLMLTDNDRVKIVDFGLARTIRQVEESGKEIVGTPLYVAPELILGNAGDFRCDIYSLGITMFELLFGYVPHMATTPHELFARKLKEDLPASQSLTPKVPEKLYDLIRNMTQRDPAERIPDYSELIRRMENVRRDLHQTVRNEQPERVPGLAIIQGTLHDRPFPEVLGEIIRRKLSGKLTISWIDLYKTLHFRDGNLIAALSSQEGERFSDLIHRHIRISGKLTRKWERQSDLFAGFSTAVREISPDAQIRIAGDLESMARTILQSLFEWMVGEFLFEPGEFPAQFTLRLNAGDILKQGIRKWLDPATVRRRLINGKCFIELRPNFIRILNHVHLDPSDRFLLFRFEHRIHFSDLLTLSGMARDEFFSLLYLFLSYGLIQAIPEQTSETTHLPADVQRKGAVQPPNTPSPEKIGLYFLECAIRSFRDRNYQACVEYCKKAIEKRKNDPKPYHLLGKALSIHPGFHHEARIVLQKALALDPQNIAIELDVAEIDFASGNYASARPLYERILKKEPNQMQATERLKEIARRKR